MDKRIETGLWSDFGPDASSAFVSAYTTDANSLDFSPDFLSGAISLFLIRSDNQALRSNRLRRWPLLSFCAGRQGPV